MSEYANVLNVILPIKPERYTYLPAERLGPAVGHGCKVIGLHLLSYGLITPEEGGLDRELLKQYPDSFWVKFSFQVSDKVLSNYERQKKKNPGLEPFDKLIADFVSDCSERLAGSLLAEGRMFL